MTLVANHFMRIPAKVHFLQVTGGFDVADNEIVQRVNAGDLVVTADIPLAAEVSHKGAVALNPSGELYTPSNIHGGHLFGNGRHKLSIAGHLLHIGSYLMHLRCYIAKVLIHGLHGFNHGHHIFTKGIDKK